MYNWIKIKILQSCEHVQVLPMQAGQLKAVLQAKQMQVTFGCHSWSTSLVQWCLGRQQQQQPRHLQLPTAGGNPSRVIEVYNTALEWNGLTDHWRICICILSLSILSAGLF